MLLTDYLGIISHIFVLVLVLEFIPAKTNDTTIRYEKIMTTTKTLLTLLVWLIHGNQRFFLSFFIRTAHLLLLSLCTLKRTYQRGGARQSAVVGPSVTEHRGRYKCGVMSECSGGADC